MGTVMSSNAHHGTQNRHIDQGHHECEVFEEGLEAEESEFLWNNCEKNPRHTNFISVKEFSDKYFHTALNDKWKYWFNALVNLTVRIRVQWTSLDRPQDDGLSDYKETDKLRLGTGSIYNFIMSDENGNPCPCKKCNGKVRCIYWKLFIRTACHVVYNTEEAKTAKVDFFYDDTFPMDGRMKTVTGVKVIHCDPEKDLCLFSCVTHDRTLVDYISSLMTKTDQNFGSNSFGFLNMFETLPYFQGHNLRYHELMLIISHPHGKTKKVSIGKLKSTRVIKGMSDDCCYEYYTATCPGSSGAPIYPIYPDSPVLPWGDFALLFPLKGIVHSGTHYEKYWPFRGQLNYSCSLPYK